MAFSPSHILTFLRASVLPDIPVRRYWVALSGGLDSMVLLHSLAELRPDLGGSEVRAIHINHGLSHYAGQWAEHCRQMCESFAIPCEVITVDAQAGTGDSPEAAARRARYAAFQSHVDEGDCLLTAHHEDDQAETLLLQLLRGAGPKGLAAMPPWAPFQSGWHGRPLLNVSREELHAYAQAQQLQWVEDESNADTGFDRNFLRHDIFPRLRKRYPGAAKTISRSARLCAEAAELLVQQAQQDLQQAALDDACLSVSACLAMGRVRCKQLLHHWLHGLRLPIPTEAQTEAIWRDVIQASADSTPLVQWAGAEVRRYRDALYAQAPLPPFDHQQCHDWELQGLLTIPGVGQLEGTQVAGSGIALEKIAGGRVQVRFRRGGESLQPQGRRETHSLKHLFQEAGIPPWLRERIPLIFCGEQLVEAVGLWRDAHFAAAPHEAGIVVALQDPMPGVLS